MQGLEEFGDIVKLGEPLAPYTYFKIGGPAEVYAEPRSRAELAGLVRRCAERGMPLRVIGGGSNVLVRDEGVRGVVVRLSAPAFTEVSGQGRRVRAGAGAALSALISEAARRSLAGLETLVGIPGTVGGAVRCNTGDRSGDVGQYVRSVEVLDRDGGIQTRERDELRFSYGRTHLDDPVLLAAEFELEADSADVIIKRMRRAWIQRKGAQPFSFQAAGRIFKNPRGFSAASLIEQAGLTKTRVGGAEVSERDANFIVAHPGAAARDVQRLMDLVRSRVREQFGIELEPEITVW